MTIQQLIKKKPYLIWHTRNLNKLSKEAIVEGVLNYGDFDDVKKMLAIIGKKEAAKIFRKQIKSRRSNYRPEIKNYFKLFFDAHA